MKSFLITFASMFIFFMVLTMILDEVTWVNIYDATKLTLLLSISRSALEYAIDNFYNI